jgi:O-antigen/teichoic acid export membrane protein
VRHDRDYARAMHRGHRRGIVRALATTAGATVAISAVSGLTGVVSTRALGPYERGLLATAVVWTSVLGSLVAAGLPQALTYFVAKEREAAASYVATALVLGAVGGVALGVVGAASALILVESPAAPAMAVLFGGIPLVIAGGLCVAAILGQARYVAWSALRILGPSLALVGVVVIATRGVATATAIVLVTATATALQAIGAFVYLRRQHLLGRPSRSAARNLLVYGWKQLIAGVGWLLTYKLDQIALTFLVAPAALGLYAVAASVGEIIAPTAASAGSVMLTRIAARGYDEVRHALPLALGFCLAVSGSLSLFAFVSGEWLLRTLFGAGFGPGADEMRILLVGSVALAVATVLGDTLRGLGRPLTAARAEMAGAVATAALLSALVPPLGILGAAIASTLSYSLVMVLLAVSLRTTLQAERASLA